jgi:hypothetical protein
MSNGQLQHKARVLRKVKFNNGGGATVAWADFFFNPESQSYVRTNEERSSDALIHDDFRAAMKPFGEHWLIFGEEVGEPKASYPFDGTLKNLERASITSVTLSGGMPEFESDEEPAPVGVHIQGTYRLRCGRVKNYCSPGIKLGSPNEKYKFATHVDEHLQALEAEAWAYLEGKQAPPAQTALAFDPEAADAGESPEVNLIGTSSMAVVNDEDNDE